MSDGKEVKRLRAVDIMFMCGEKNGVDTDFLFVSASDHDRIVAKLRAELFAVNHKLTKHRAANKMLETAIATQARVIQIAKRVLHNAGLRPPDGGTPTVETICEDLNDAIIEIAAIEKEETKDG